jgi:hypothetical protein
MTLPEPQVEPVLQPSKKCMFRGVDLIVCSAKIRSIWI